GKGKLQYIGEHFLQFSNNEYFLKIGANSPEVFLEYVDFDDTDSERSYPEHIKDWKPSDPTWKDGKGKGIIGIVNYLVGQEQNTHYFLVMNAYGDGKKAVPWTGVDDYYQYDVSKLDQWQIVFDHMMKMGLMPQFVLSEQENQSYFEHKEGGDFADSRKVFYREMVARFGYLNAVTWNIGEESGWEKVKPYGTAISSDQRKDFASYLQDLLYFNDHVVVHNGPSNTDAIFTDLLGDPNFTGLSYQGNFENPLYGHDRIAHWRKESAAKGHKWVVSYDEPYTGPEFPALDTWRKNAVWASFLAGGAGVEFYIGAGRDLTIQNYYQYEAYWQTMKFAREFFIHQDIPFYEMEAADHLITEGWCLSKPGDVYVVYLPEGGSSSLKLEGGDFEVKWYNPRNGGSLQRGTVTSLSGEGTKSIGNAPLDQEKDWVVWVKKASKR
ncbi:MAG: putative collagen-binding domain-containing protein, partial [Cyclobacteriaceae bacterium]